MILLASQTVNVIVCADCSSMAGRRYVQLQKQVEQLQEELYRSETGTVSVLFSFSFLSWLVGFFSFIVFFFIHVLVLIFMLFFSLILILVIPQF